MSSMMEHQTVTFTPRDDYDQANILRTQVEHDMRISRLEKRQDEDARVKSVWGSSSPFPTVLGGTPQQVPMQPPAADAFSTFDDQPTNMLSSLHIDPVEEPRRLGTTSRANSVRFDETANQSHGVHACKSSTDLISRPGGTSPGGHPMTGRTLSYKSDGWHSSAAASVHSATSGRANSLGLESEVPHLAPGLLILGFAPAIIRCWLTRNFKHNSLLYAAVCTGSYTSCLDQAFVTMLGFESEIRIGEHGVRKIKLELYLPEAVPCLASSRCDSPPTPQLPSLLVDFTVVETPASAKDSKAIRIFLGSDLLRSHSADILLSSNKMTLFDDDRTKLSIPLVRPEDDQAFKTLQVSNSPWAVANGQDKQQATLPETRPCRDPVAEILPQSLQGLKAATMPPATVGSDSDRTVGVSLSDDAAASLNVRRSLESSSNGNDAKEPTGGPSMPATDTSRATSPPSLWGTWRRAAERSDSADWANASKTGANDTYQRRETGIKVLKPIRTSYSRTASVTAHGPASASTPTAQSRFFDEGRRRVTSVSAASTSANRPTSANPVGDASAFPWLGYAQR